MASLVMARAGAAPVASRNERAIQRFLPVADVQERHETIVHAPADIVLAVAREFDLESLPLIRTIFWLREKLLRASPAPSGRPRGLVAATRAMGWGILHEEPGREYVSGAVTQPWKGNVVFRAIPTEKFVAFSEPDLVKIVWTLETEPLTDDVTLFRTETRVRATDASARKKFLRYWRSFGAGIVLIRWLSLGPIRREAERRYRRDLRNNQGKGA